MVKREHGSLPDYYLRGQAAIEEQHSINFGDDATKRVNL